MGIGSLGVRWWTSTTWPSAEAFYSELTGIPVIPSVYPGRYAYLGQPDPWRADLIMHLVATLKGPEANGATSTSGCETSMRRFRGSRRSAAR